MGCSISNNIQASALDQSGQSILPFLESGNYFEFNAFAVDSSISGVVHDRSDLVRDGQSRDTGNIGKSSQFYTAALKLQLSDQFSFGLIYDQPYAAKTAYPLRPNNSYSDNDFSQQGTSVEVKTQDLSFILGYSPLKNFQIYGGPVYQSVSGNVALRGMRIQKHLMVMMPVLKNKQRLVGLLVRAIRFQKLHSRLRSLIVRKSNISFKLMRASSESH